MAMLYDNNLGGDMPYAKALHIVILEESPKAVEEAIELRRMRIAGSDQMPAAAGLDAQQLFTLLAQGFLAEQDDEWSVADWPTSVSSPCGCSRSRHCQRRRE